MISKIDIGPGARVLDVGRGVGGPALRLARRTGAEVVGIAVSREQVKRANESQVISQIARVLRPGESWH